MNFITSMDDNSFYLRKIERGVEGETRSCDTGSIASVTNACEKGKLNNPNIFYPTSKGPHLINFDDPKKSFHNVQLTGRAITTYPGSVDV